MADGSMKYMYRCKFAKRRAKNPCESKYCIYEPSDEMNKYVLQHNGHDHNHEDLDSDDISSKISFELRDMIIDLSLKKMRVKKIIALIKDSQEKHGLFQGEEIPNKQQIYYLVRKHKNDKAPPIVSIGELFEWCQANSVVPEDEDEAFVVDYDMSDEEESMYFRFVVSTKRLLSHCQNLQNICADATYKLVWQGFPFLVMGTVDRAKKFHPLCFSCTSHEQQDDFEFLFQTIKSATEKFGGYEFHPKLLISNASYAITNAFDEIFPGGKKIMCYSHVK